MNAVHYNHLQEMEPKERQKFLLEKMQVYNSDLDIVRLGAEMVVDDIITPETVREELLLRYKLYSQRCPEKVNKRRTIFPT